MRLLFILILLTGCTSLEIPPPTEVSGDKIFLKIESQELYEKPIPLVWSARNLKIQFYSSDNICPWSNKDNLKSTYLFTVNMDNKTPTKSIEIPLAKNNQKIYAFITDSNGTTLCPQNIYFTPENGSSYYLDIKAHFNPLSRCKAKLYTLVEDKKFETPSFKWAGPNSPLMGLYNRNKICKM